MPIVDDGRARTTDIDEDSGDEVCPTTHLTLALRTPCKGDLLVATAETPCKFMAKNRLSTGSVSTAAVHLPRLSRTALAAGGGA